MKAIHDYLRNLPCFRDLSDEELGDAAHGMALRRLSRGEILSLEGDPCTTVFFVLEGRILATKMSTQGREQVLEELSAGDGFHMGPALDSQPLPTTTRAATRATLLAMSRTDFVSLLHDYPDLTLCTLVVFAQRLRRLGSLVESLALRSVSQRLAELLMRRAESSDRHRVTQRDIAAQLGTVREVIARTLAQFDDQGWISLQRGVIEILDVEALRGEASL